jgi:hypothetical protein
VVDAALRSAAKADRLAVLDCRASPTRGLAEQLRGFPQPLGQLEVLSRGQRTRDGEHEAAVGVGADVRMLAALGFLFYAALDEVEQLPDGDDGVVRGATIGLASQALEEEMSEHAVALAHCSPSIDDSVAIADVISDTPPREALRALR